MRQTEIVRWLLERVLKLTGGDWRNWDQIRDWTASLAQQLAPAARETALSA